MKFFSSFVLIYVLLIGTCQGQRFFSFSDGCLDADGRPNLMKFIWQRGNLNGFELTNYEREKLFELQILLPDQKEFLNDFAWREIYLSGSFMEFMNHSFIQKELKFSDSQLSKLLPQLNKICTDATDRVKKNRDEFSASIQQILGQDASSRLKLLVGP